MEVDAVNVNTEVVVVDRFARRVAVVGDAHSDVVVLVADAEYDGVPLAVVQFCPNVLLGRLIAHGEGQYEGSIDVQIHPDLVEAFAAASLTQKLA